MLCADEGRAGRERPQRSDRKRAGTGVDSEATGGYFGDIDVAGGGDLGIAVDVGLRYGFQNGEGPIHCMS